MFDGYLTLGGVEVLNRARTAAYIRELLAGRVDVLCADDGLARALGHGSYSTPSIDRAPWVRGNRPAGGRFCGLFPGKMIGAEDSTHTVEVTELSSSGAVMTSPRYGSKEIRFVATALALDEEAMEEGLAWLREVTANDGCSEVTGLGCTGQEARMFTARPEDQLEAFEFARVFHNVEVTAAPKVSKKHPVKGFLMWEVEFLITAGIPWAFTSTAEVGVLAMDEGVNFQDPAGQNCADVRSAYDDFVADPFFTDIHKPPRPPAILPPNLLKITSWRRRSLPIPSNHTQRWGRAVPIVHVATELEVQYLRIRFYREGKGACDYDGEFFVSYIPSTAVLTLNGITRQATLKLWDGRVVPAGHLLFGSDGLPFTWPTLGCQQKYTMVADLMPGQLGVAVILETAVRE